MESCHLQQQEAIMLNGGSQPQKDKRHMTSCVGSESVDLTEVES